MPGRSSVPWIAAQRAAPTEQSPARRDACRRCAARPRPITFRLLLTVCLLCGSAAAQDTVRAPLGLDVSLPAAKRIAGARESIAVADWPAAIAAIENVSHEFSGSLIEVATGHYLNVELACAALLAGLPPEGLAEYRRRTDPPLLPLFAEAAARRDPELMQQVVREGFASSAGGDALNWLAEDAFERGELDRARSWWASLVPPAPAAPATAPRYPDSPISRAELCARLILCSLMEGDHVRAARELAAFRRMFGDVPGRLAGRSGPLADILAVLLSESGQWHRAPQRDWPTLGGDNSRSPRSGMRPHLESILWSRPLPDAGLPLVERTRLALPSNAPPAWFPVVWDGTVLLSDARSVSAWDLTTGHSAWPADGPDDAVIYADDEFDADLIFPTSGVPRYSASVHSGRYYTRLGWPVAVPAARGLPQRPARLICLDLHAQGRLEWSAPGDALQALAGGQWSGPPLVVDGRVYAAVRRPAPQIEIGVACLDAGTGELVWERRLCAAMQQPPAAYHLVDHEVLACGEGLVFHAPGSGVIAALEVESGALRWAVAYPSNPLSLAAASDPRIAGVSAPVYQGGRLFVKPADSDRLMAFDAASGTRLWSVDLPGRVVELLGVASGRLIASGDQLWGLRCEDGEAWRFGFDDPEGFGFGRGVVADGHIYWTTRDELFVVEVMSGQVVDRLPLEAWAGLSGGNLLVADERLLIAAPQRLTVLGAR